MVRLAKELRMKRLTWIGVVVLVLAAGLPLASQNPTMHSPA
jgi:hypothetical protein